MQRNPSLRTYERKRFGVHSTSSIGNTIIRENGPPDKNAESRVLIERNDEDNSMMDDPFDTAFDRLLRTAKMPPKPPSDDVDSSYAGSSSDDERAEDDSVIPLPPIFVEPVQKKRRFIKREKSDKKVLAVKTGGLKKRRNRPGRPAKVRLDADENSEPNVERLVASGGKNRGKKPSVDSGEETARKPRAAKKRTPTESYRSKKRTSLDDSPKFAQCSVNLTPLDLLDATVEKLPNVSRGNRKTEVSEKAATPGPSTIHDKSLNVEEFIEKSATFVDATPTMEISNRSGLLKSSTIRLNRLSVPERFSTANKSWINSTPIDRRIATKKTWLRLSPIDANGSMRFRRSDENSDQASSPSKFFISEPVVAESTVPKNAQSSSEIDVDERSEKRRAFVLTESSAPSCLLFDDTEAQNDRSQTETPSTGREQSENRRSIILSESPAPELSCRLFEDSETANEESQTEKKLQDVTEASTTSPFKGFSVESPHPPYEASNKTASSEKFSSSSAKNPAVEFSLVDEKIHGETMENSTTSEPKELTRDSSDGESLNLILIDDDDEDEDEKSLRNFSDAPTNEHVPRFADRSKNSTLESATFNSDKFNSDDDWTTVTGSSHADADVSEGKDIPAKSGWEISGGSRQESIEQLSSSEDDSLSNDISELVNANYSSFSHMEVALESGVETNFEEERNALFEDINGNESKIQERSVDGEKRETETRKEIHRHLRQPVVLLERLVLPVGKLTMGFAKNTRKLNPAESTELNQNSTSSSVDESISDVEKPISLQKSIKPLEIEKTIATSFSDTIESSKNSTLSSADHSISNMKTAVLTRKSKRLSRVKKTFAASFSDNIESSKNSTLSSADNSISNIETPSPARNSKSSADGTISDIEEEPPSGGDSCRPTITKKVASKDPSDSIEWSQNSTVDSADGNVSDIEEHSTKKSKRFSTLENMIAISFCDRLESALNTTDSVSSSETPDAEKKSKTLSEVETSIDELLARKSNTLKSNEESVPKDPSDSPELSGGSTASKNSLEERSKGDQEPRVYDRKSKSSNLSILNPRKIDAEEDTRLGSVNPVVLLTRLNDPVRVSLRRRQKYSNTHLQLSVIAENTVKRAATTIEEAHEENSISESSRSMRNIHPQSVKQNGEEINSQQTTVSVDSSFSLNTINESRLDDRRDRPLFLKPGKLWARSLSILSNVHSQEDLDILAVGKGKKWRESAANILQMQQQGLLQSCVKKNEDGKESRSTYGVRNSAATWSAESSQSNTSRVLGAASPERFVRRVSIRVVPDGKGLDRLENSPFLEAYGITSSRNRQTTSKRSTSIGPRKTLVYNVQDVSYDISRGINSTTSRDVVLKQCGQETSLPFDECYPLSYLKHCRKIGEGVYGEVFLYEKGDEKNVIKIIPIEGDMNVNNERQKKFDEILSEIVIAKELNNLRFAESSSTSSFVEVKNIRCVVGKYPRKLIDLWRTYDDEKNSENDCPVMFDKNQLYIVLELGHGGQDLEAFVFQNASESHALFMQTAVALAVAEEKLDFEHRDLHWGNILISRTEESHVEYKLRDKSIRLVSKGVKVSVIDFTLSRMSYQGCSIYNDLSMDEDLFSAQGEYQFEIYRLMRKKVENDWQRFEPFTNVLWLHYTLDKMITAARYRRKNSKIHNTSIEKLRELKDMILDYKSAFDFVTNCDKATRLQGSRTSVATVG